MDLIHKMEDVSHVLKGYLLVVVLGLQECDHLVHLESQSPSSASSTCQSLVHLLFEEFPRVLDEYVVVIVILIDLTTELWNSLT